MGLFSTPIFNVLRMMPILPSSKRLVNTYNKEINNLVATGTLGDATAVKRAASRVVDTLMSDGKITRSEISALNKAKEHLNRDYREDVAEFTERRAAVNIFNALEIDRATRSVRVVEPNFTLGDPR